MDIRFDIVILYTHLIGDAVLHLSILLVFMVFQLKTTVAMSLLVKVSKVYAKLSDAPSCLKCVCNLNAFNISKCKMIYSVITSSLLSLWKPTRMLLIILFVTQMATHPGYYASLIEKTQGRTTIATDEIERDLHR